MKHNNKTGKLNEKVVWIKIQKQLQIVLTWRKKIVHYTEVTSGFRCRLTSYMSMQTQWHYDRNTHAWASLPSMKWRKKKGGAADWLITGTKLWIYTSAMLNELHNDIHASTLFCLVFLFLPKSLRCWRNAFQKEYCTWANPNRNIHFLEPIFSWACVNCQNSDCPMTSLWQIGSTSPWTSYDATRAGRGLILH